MANEETFFPWWSCRKRRVEFIIVYPIRIVLVRHFDIVLGQFQQILSPLEVQVYALDQYKM